MTYRLVLDENVEHVDFVLEVDETEYRGTFYLDDATLSVEKVADVIQTVSRHYPQSEVDGLEYLGDEWL
jgi:hypothetical protein